MVFNICILGMQILRIQEAGISNPGPKQSLFLVNGEHIRLYGLILFNFIYNINASDIIETVR